MKIDNKNSKMWSQIGPRATFGLACLNLSDKEDNLMILSSDVSTSAGLDRYKKKFPENNNPKIQVIMAKLIIP